MTPTRISPRIFRPTTIQASIDGDVAEFGDYWVCSHCRVVPFELVACPKCGKPRTMADVGPVDPCDTQDGTVVGLALLLMAIAGVFAFGWVYGAGLVAVLSE